MDDRELSRRAAAVRRLREPRAHALLGHGRRGEAGVEHVLVLRVVERVSDDRERLHVLVFIGMQVGGMVGGGRIARFSIVGFRRHSILRSGREGVKAARPPVGVANR